MGGPSGPAQVSSLVTPFWLKVQLLACVACVVAPAPRRGSNSATDVTRKIQKSAGLTSSNNLDKAHCDGGGLGPSGGLALWKASGMLKARKIRLILTSWESRGGLTKRPGHGESGSSLAWNLLGSVRIRW